MMALQAYYDTRYAPITFDYANFLVCAEAYRQSINLPRINLHVVASSFRDISVRDVKFMNDEKFWRVNHILMRIPNLIPSISQVTLYKTPPETLFYPTFPSTYPPRTPEESLSVTPYLMDRVSKFHNLGCNVRPFKASNHARKLVKDFTSDKPYFTISLRTSNFQIERNSNLEEWYKVYSALKESSFNVFVIPDFEDILTKNEAKKYDWKLVEFAAFELDLRLALYENAIDNLCVSNGTSVIAFYSNSPVKMFKIVVDGITATSEKSLKYSSGVARGNAPSFCKDNQKWIWEDDTFENIMATLKS